MPAPRAVLRPAPTGTPLWLAFTSTPAPPPPPPPSLLLPALSAHALFSGWLCACPFLPPASLGALPDAPAWLPRWALLTRDALHLFETTEASASGVPTSASAAAAARVALRLDRRLPLRDLVVEGLQVAAAAAAAAAPADDTATSTAPAPPSLHDGAGHHGTDFFAWLPSQPCLLFRAGSDGEAAAWLLHIAAARAAPPDAASPPLLLGDAQLAALAETATARAARVSCAPLLARIPAPINTAAAAASALHSYTVRQQLRSFCRRFSPESLALLSSFEGVSAVGLLGARLTSGGDVNGAALSMHARFVFQRYFGARAPSPVQLPPLTEAQLTRELRDAATPTAAASALRAVVPALVAMLYERVLQPFARARATRFTEAAGAELRAQRVAAAVAPMRSARSFFSASSRRLSLSRSDSSVSAESFGGKARGLSVSPDKTRGLSSADKARGLSIAEKTRGLSNADGKARGLSMARGSTADARADEFGAAAAPVRATPTRRFSLFSRGDGAAPEDKRRDEAEDESFFDVAAADESAAALVDSDSSRFLARVNAANIPASAVGALVDAALDEPAGVATAFKSDADALTALIPALLAIGEHGKAAWAIARRDVRIVRLPAVAACENADFARAMRDEGLTPSKLRAVVGGDAATAYTAELWEAADEDGSGGLRAAVRDAMTSAVLLTAEMKGTLADTVVESVESPRTGGDGLEGAVYKSVFGRRRRRQTGGVAATVAETDAPWLLAHEDLLLTGKHWAMALIAGVPERDAAATAAGAFSGVFACPAGLLGAPAVPPLAFMSQARALLLEVPSAAATSRGAYPVPETARAALWAYWSPGVPRGEAAPPNMLSLTTARESRVSLTLLDAPVGLPAPAPVVVETAFAIDLPSAAWSSVDAALHADGVFSLCAREGEGAPAAPPMSGVWRAFVGRGVSEPRVAAFHASASLAVSQTRQSWAPVHAVDVTIAGPAPGVLTLFDGTTDARAAAALFSALASAAARPAVVVSVHAALVPAAVTGASRCRLQVQAELRLAPPAVSAVPAALLTGPLQKRGALRSAYRWRDCTLVATSDKGAGWFNTLVRGLSARGDGGGALGSPGAPASATRRLAQKIALPLSVRATLTPLPATLSALSAVPFPVARVGRSSLTLAYAKDGKPKGEIQLLRGGLGLVHALSVKAPAEDAGARQRVGLGFFGFGGAAQPSDALEFTAMVDGRLWEFSGPSRGATGLWVTALSLGLIPRAEALLALLPKRATPTVPDGVVAVAWY